MFTDTRLSIMDRRKDWKRQIASNGNVDPERNDEKLLKIKQEQRQMKERLMKNMVRRKSKLIAHA